MKVGIDLGGSHIAIGVIDNNYKIVEKYEQRLMEKEKKDIKNTIEGYITDNVKKFLAKYDITEIGIAVPGTVSNGIIIKSVNLDVYNYDLIKNLNKNINIPIKIRNDAKCAAIAESKVGVLKKYKNSLFLTLGTGIGGAAIINNKLLDTGKMPGCEFGHIVIQKDGLKCNCGKDGCFEKYASMKALKTNLRKTLKLDENTSGKQLLEIIMKHPENEKIQRVIDEFIEYLSIGLSNLINIFEPEAIAIGGSFVYYKNILLEKLIKNIQEKNYLFNKRDKLIILPASLENDAGIIGSVI